MSVIFDLLTSPLGLPINPLYEYVIMFVVGVISFRLAYKAVGELMLGNGFLNSLFHWIIRFIIFVVLWAILHGVCQVLNFIVLIFN